MITLLFLVMLTIDRYSFLPRLWLPPTFVILSTFTMIAEGLQ